MVLKHGFAKAKLWNTCHTIGSHLLLVLKHDYTEPRLRKSTHWTDNRMCYTTGSHTPLSTVSEGWFLPMGVCLSSFLLLREMNRASCQVGQNWIIFAMFYGCKEAANSIQSSCIRCQKKCDTIPGLAFLFKYYLSCACCIQLGRVTIKFTQEIKI